MIPVRKLSLIEYGRSGSFSVVCRFATFPVDSPRFTRFEKRRDLYISVRLFDRKAMRAQCK
jgi:hypothetical protein